MRHWRDHERFWFSEGLQACSQVGGLADDVPFLGLAGPDQFSDDNQAGGDADANLEPFGCSEVPDRLDLSQARAYCSLGIILLSVRISEIDQHTVAHVSGDEAVVLADRLCNTLVISPDYFPQILGIEP